MTNPPSSPDQIQAEIEQTRANLAGDVDRLGEKVAPGAVMRRRTDDVKHRAASWRDRIMGSADDGGGVLGASSSVGDAASTVGDVARSAPTAVKSRTQGNPLAAGMIAFGVGWLLASLAPATEAEKQVADTAESAAREHAEPLKQAGQSLAEDLKEPLQQGVEQVKQTATEAAQETAEQAKSAADDVKQPLQN